MTKLEKYASEYASLIAQGNEVKAAIRALLEAEQDARPASFPDKVIDLSEVRDFYFSDENYHEGMKWQGWVYAVCNWNDGCEGCVGEYDSSYYSTDSGEYRLAELLDKKTANKSRLGIVKRSICAIGRGILKNDL